MLDDYSLVDKSKWVHLNKDLVKTGKLLVLVRVQ